MLAYENMSPRDRLGHAWSLPVVEARPTLARYCVLCVAFAHEVLAATFDRRDRARLSGSGLLSSRLARTEWRRRGESTGRWRARSGAAAMPPPGSDPGRRERLPTARSTWRGNIEEWVADWYDHDYYATAPESDPLGPEADGTSVQRRVRRGGSYLSEPDRLRSPRRSSGLPEVAVGLVGFRCVQ